MKRIILLLVVLCSLPAFAQTAAIQGHSYLGGTQAQVSGLSSTNYLNGIIPHATITVYLTGTQTLATIYADANSTPLSNPFTSNDVGSVNPGGWLFYAAINQGYDVCMSGGVSPNTYSQPVCLTDVYPGFSFTGTYLPLAGGTLTGATDQMFFNPLRSGVYWNAISPRFDNFVLSGTIPGTSAYNSGNVHHFYLNDWFLDTTPGCWGFATGAACPNSEHVLNQQTMYVNGGGGTNVNSISGNFFSVGDHIGSENYINSFGGSVDSGGPEGTKGESWYVNEPTDTWTGTVATGHGGVGQTLIYASCVTDCGTFNYGVPTTPAGTNAGTPASLGQGLIVTDEQATVASGQIESIANPSGETPGTMTVNITSGVANLAVSTCEATLTSNLNPTTDPSGSGTQSLTFTVNVVTGTCAAGGLMSFAGTNHEQATIASVTALSGGQQTITANIAKYHESGSYLFENAGSDAGLFADVVANHSGSLSFPFEVLGVQSISGNTAVLWYRYWLSGSTPGVNGFPYGRLVVGTIPNNGSVSNTSGTVTFTVPTAYAWQNAPSWTFLNRASAVYFSGAANTAFNGPCTNVVLTNLTSPTGGNATFTCTQAASSGQTSSSLNISLTDSTNDNPYGNSRVNFYQGAAIVDPQDYSAPIVVNGVSNPVVDGKQFTVEPNEMTLTAGDSLVEHHSAAQFHAVENTVTVQNPTCYSCNGVKVDLTGVSDNGGSAVNNFAFEARNNTALSQYQYFGGTLPAPPLMVQYGNFGDSLYLYNPPAAGHYVINSPNCPSSPSSCTDPGYWYGLYSFLGNGGVNNAQYFPATNTMQWNGTQQFNGQVTVAGNQVAQTIAHGSTALGTSAIASGACATTITVAASGVATTDVVTGSFNGDVSGVTGFGPATTGMLNVRLFPTANNVNIQVCNNTGASITPGAATVNWRVER